MTERQMREEVLTSLIAVREVITDVRKILSHSHISCLEYSSQLWDISRSRAIASHSYRFSTTQGEDVTVEYAFCDATAIRVILKVNEKQLLVLYDGRGVSITPYSQGLQKTLTISEYPVGLYSHEIDTYCRIIEQTAHLVVVLLRLLFQVVSNSHRFSETIPPLSSVIQHLEKAISSMS